MRAAAVEQPAPREVGDEVLADELLRAVRGLRRRERVVVDDVRQRAVAVRAVDRERAREHEARRRPAALHLRAQRRGGRSARVASRFARSPRSRSSSHSPETAAARWNTASKRGASSAPRPRGAERVELARRDAHPRIVHERRRRRGAVGEVERGERASRERAPLEQRLRDAPAEEAGGAGDEHVHGRDPAVGDRSRPSVGRRPTRSWEESPGRAAPRRTRRRRAARCAARSRSNAAATVSGVKRSTAPFCARISGCDISVSASACTRATCPLTAAERSLRARRRRRAVLAASGRLVRCTSGLWPTCATSWSCCAVCAFGEIAFTRMPCSSRSRAQLYVYVATAALLAE